MKLKIDNLDEIVKNAEELITNTEKIIKNAKNLQENINDIEELITNTEKIIKNAKNLQENINDTESFYISTIITSNIKQHIKDNIYILRENTMSAVYFRKNEVFFLINNNLTDTQIDFWYKFKTLNLFDNIIEICVGNDKLWERISKRLGWEEFFI